MRGILPIIWLLIIVVSAVAAFFVLPLVGVTIIPTTTNTGNTGTFGDIGSGSPDTTPQPAFLVVDSYKFCTELTEGVCATHATSFTAPARVYVTLSYSKATVGKVLAFKWYKAGTVLSGDGQGIEQASGTLVTSLGQPTEGVQAMSPGSYSFKIMDESGNVAKDSTGSELAYNFIVE